MYFLLDMGRQFEPVAWRAGLSHVVLF